MIKLQVIKGVYFVLACVFSSWLGSCFIMLPSLPLAIMAPHIYRVYVQFMMGTWFLFPPAIYELLFGTTIHISGDRMIRREKSFIIANHRTRLDWMFMWSLTGRAKWSALEKIILRGDLRHIPGFGWAMQFGGFFFLSRKWVKDELYLTKKINYMMTALDPYKLLIFPEGTDYEPRTKAKSDAFGEKMGYPHLDYLLHPRTTGFIHCLQELSKGDVTALYDITLGYPNVLPDKGEADLVMGRFPKEIHINIKRYEFSTIPKEQADTWLRNVWYNKEKVLQKFYKDGKFEEENPREPYFSKSEDNFRVPIFMLWNCGMILITYLLYCSPSARSYFMFANFVLFILSTAGVLEDLDRKFDIPEIREQSNTEQQNTSLRSKKSPKFKHKT